MSRAGTTSPGRPWHVWVVGIIGGLWSAMGVLSFALTQMSVEAVMLPDQIRLSIHVDVGHGLHAPVQIPRVVRHEVLSADHRDPVHRPHGDIAGECVAPEQVGIPIGVHVGAAHDLVGVPDLRGGRGHLRALRQASINQTDIDPLSCRNHTSGLPSPLKSAFDGTGGQSLSNTVTVAVDRVSVAFTGEVRTAVAARWL